MDRWKTKLAESEIVSLETLIGDCLEEFGYKLSVKKAMRDQTDRTLALMRMAYPPYFEAKIFLQSKTVVGRFAKGTRLELTSPA